MTGKAPAANLSFSTPPPASIVAGVGFNIEVEILDKDGERLTEQTATQLVMVNNADIKPKIGANCPIEPNIILEIRDSSDCYNNNELYIGTFIDHYRAGHSGDNGPWLDSFKKL
ncbi:hypothetical protein KUTeg_001505 [Tegillarca granosa]|uniref:Uncharacterized protein n=1 Tax=Tegillarca granosa TaxID=220873 RepID=A0ABQ9FW41_TEGGR|nr:hypothetical protein KUTeg_001505 [Tegillarca granosa]